MESFQYVDIFYTKGFEYIVVIFFLLILIPFWRYVISPVQPNVGLQGAGIRGVFDKIALSIPRGIHLDPTHTWAFLERSGKVRVGVDDFLMHVTGKITQMSSPKKGVFVKKGDVLSIIEHNGKSLKLYSPINGKIVKQNNRIHRNPERIGKNSLFNDWLFKIEPSNWAADSKLLLLSAKAEDWLKKEYDRLRDFLVFSSQKYSINPSMIALQEGGPIQDYVLSNLSAEVWEEFQSEFIDANRITS